MSVTWNVTVNPNLGRITRTAFKGKSPEKRFVPKMVYTKTNFTAYCEEFENYCIVSSVECINGHQVGQNAVFSQEFRYQYKFWPV